MTDVTALFRFRNKSKHPGGATSFLRAIDYTDPGFKEENKVLILQVLNITGGAGGPYYIDFSNVTMEASAVVKTKSGYVERRARVAYSEIRSHNGVLEYKGMGSVAFHLDLPDLSDIDSGTGAVGVCPDSFVTIMDIEGKPWNFTALGMPLVPGTPVTQKYTSQTFAIVGAP